MEAFQVKFTCLPDPQNPNGIVLKYTRVGSITPEQSPLCVNFRSAAELDSAFIAAGIYLRSYSHPDPEAGARPDPDQDYEVTVTSLRTLGFDLAGSNE